MADIIPQVTPWGDPIPGSASPYKIVPAVINATWNLGQDMRTLYSAKIDAATTSWLATANAPHVTAGTVDLPTIAEPTVDIPSTASATDIMSTFDTKYMELVTMLSDKFVAFRAAYFPDESNAYIAAENWLQDAIANPEAGLPASVVAQIWGDDQARILADKTRAQDAVIAQFAGRRFPLPPDAAASAVMQIEQKAQDELAESSRKVAILSVELQKFNVEKLLGLRGMAMDSAVKYISALASGPDMATKLVGIGYDAQSKLISAAAAFYNARTQAKETISKVAQYNNSTALEAAVKNQMADLTLVEDRLKALLAEAQALAQMATSLFNNAHVSAGISGSGGTNVSYNYSNDTQSAAPTVTSVG